jgi:hypothetical protein
MLTAEASEMQKKRMQDRPGKTTSSYRISDRARTILKEMADQDLRSLSAMVEVLILQEAARRGESGQCPPRSIDMAARRKEKVKK